MSEKKFIDIKEIIKQKNPKLIKWLPGFVLKYIKRIVHEDDINQIMRNTEGLSGLDFVNALITQEFNIDINLIGGENIPLEGGVIFAANHPLGGVDGVAFMHALGKYRQDIRFLVNDVLMHIKNYEPLFVPINKHGAQAREATKLVIETYQSDQALLIFPAGLVSRKQNDGSIKDLEWKKSFIAKAKKYHKNIIPVYIDGRNSNFFYNLSRFRKAIGIAANIEMFYLADETMGQKNKKVNIIIGKPIPYTQLDKSKTDQEWADSIKEIVYSLA